MIERRVIHMFLDQLFVTCKVLVIDGAQRDVELVRFLAGKVNEKVKFIFSGTTLRDERGEDYRSVPYFRGLVSCFKPYETLAFSVPCLETP